MTSKELVLHFLSKIVWKTQNAKFLTILILSTVFQVVEKKTTEFRLHCMGLLDFKHNWCLKDWQPWVKSSNNKYEEAERKLKIVENDLERIIERAEEFESKVSLINNKIKYLINKKGPWCWRRAESHPGKSEGDGTRGRRELRQRGLLWKQTQAAPGGIQGKISQHQAL